jgi:hypothetical protein
LDFALQREDLMAVLGPVHQQLERGRPQVLDPLHQPGVDFMKQFRPELCMDKNYNKKL